MDSPLSRLDRSFWIEVLRKPLSVRYWIGATLFVLAALGLKQALEASTWPIVAAVVCACVALEVWLRARHEHLDAGTDSHWAFSAPAFAIGTGLYWFPLIPTAVGRIALVAALVLGWLVIQFALLIAVKLVRGPTLAPVPPVED